MGKLTAKQIADLESTIIDTRVEQPHYRMLCFGDVGTGKTTWATRANCKTLVIDCSEGWVVATDQPNVTFMRFVEIDQLGAVAAAISDGLPGWNYDLVVLDEASAMYQLVLDDVVASYVAKNGAESRDNFVPEQRDYLAAQGIVMRQVNKILKAPVNTLILAHERRTKDEKTGQVYIEADFAPRLLKEMTRTLHVLGRITPSEDGKTRDFQVHPTKGIQAKTRLPIENNVSLPEILALNNKESSNGSV